MGDRDDPDNVMGTNLTIDYDQWRSQDFSEGEAIVTTQFYGGPPPGNFLKFGSLKRHFLNFEGTFGQNI